MLFIFNHNNINNYKFIINRANFTGGTFSYVEYYSFVSRQVSGLPG